MEHTAHDGASASIWDTEFAEACEGVTKMSGRLNTSKRKAPMTFIQVYVDNSKGCCNILLLRRAHNQGYERFL
jgi:hypothetical protein